MIFGEPWHLWVFLAGLVMIYVGVEDSLVAWGLMKKPEDVHPVWDKVRSRLLGLIVVGPLFLAYLVLFIG